MDFQEFVEKREQSRRPWLFQPTVEKAKKKKGGGPGYHAPHVGRPGEIGGSRPRTAAGGSAAEAIGRMVPKENLAGWTVPKAGLLEAENESGDWVDTLAFNPKTQTLVFGGGGQSHAELVAAYAKDEKYDDFVKLIYDETQNLLEMDTSRTSARNAAEGWELGFDTAKALVQAGFPKNLTIGLTLPKAKFEPGKEVEIKLKELV